jgi:hypothetical protein
MGFNRCLLIDNKGKKIYGKQYTAKVNIKINTGYLIIPHKSPAKRSPLQFGLNKYPAA